MKVTITGKHIDISPEIKKYIEDELYQLEKYEKHILNAKAVIERNDKRYHIEMEIAVKKHQFTASDEDFELIPSIDNTFKKLKSQLIKYEKKLHDHKKYQ